MRGRVCHHLGHELLLVPHTQTIPRRPNHLSRWLTWREGRKTKGMEPHEVMQFEHSLEWIGSHQHQSGRQNMLEKEREGKGWNHIKLRAFTGVGWSTLNIWKVEGGYWERFLIHNDHATAKVRPSIVVLIRDGKREMEGTQVYRVNMKNGTNVDTGREWEQKGKVAKCQKAGRVDWMWVGDIRVNRKGRLMKGEKAEKRDEETNGKQWQYWREGNRKGWTQFDDTGINN